MAKQPPLPDRFRITCETTETEMGVLIAQLTRMGFTNVSFELVHDIRTFNRNVPHEISSDDFALAWIAEHPTFKAIDIVRHFEANGRTNSATYATLKRLVDDGKLVKLGSGNYQRADVKAIEAPAARKSREFPTSGEDEILKFARAHGDKFTTHQLIKRFAEQGRSRNSIYASTDGLLKKKIAKRVGKPGSGEYVLLAKGKKTKPAPKASAPAAHLNGGNGAAPATANEVETNG